ncbi:MAG TPA: RagB/SusD family nutrient uptake outer membrane protein, partial [Anseongella sp.]|nr:RagB/SusD family nutrient uptake outer membrane protein [Anseongella sp.]
RSRSGSTYGSTNALMLEPAFIGVDNAYGNYRAPTEDIFNLWKERNNASVDIYSNIWAWLYETINAANTIIGRAENEGISWTEEEKNLVLAEARCIRAWAYRHLTYLWGDVPLTVEESSGSNIKTDWERTPVAEVRRVMEEDWLFAEAHLPVEPSSPGRVIKGLVQHYLAELYLAMDDPEKAREAALRVIQEPAYQLVTQRYGAGTGSPGTPFTDMFLSGNANRSEGNTEALWVIQNEQNVIGGEGYNIMARYWINRYYSLRVGGENPVMVTGENGGRGIGRLGPTKFAIDLYEPGDDRGSPYAWRFFWQINNPDGIPEGYELGDTIYLDTTSVETLTNPNWPHTRKWDHVNPIDPSSATQYNDQV